MMFFIVASKAVNIDAYSISTTANYNQVRISRPRYKHEHSSKSVLIDTKKSEVNSCEIPKQDEDKKNPLKNQLYCMNNDNFLGGRLFRTLAVLIMLVVLLPLSIVIITVIYIKKIRKDIADSLNNKKK